jgi:dTDP-4-amino-4,6-dideoxygalactose transaminase
MEKINLYKPFQSASALTYIKEVLEHGKLESGGKFSISCKNWFLKNYQSDSVYLTSSCTDALEMAALLADLKQDDEVILPSYTFVSTANAFLLRGCKLIFADSLHSSPNIGWETILPLVTVKTKLIVVMHYAGISVDMDPLKTFARDKGILLVEDAAQAIGARYKGKYLGTISDIGAISFHSTKMISCGEGGCCIINNPEIKQRAELVFEKGTNRLAFQRNEVSKYEWVDLGSSYGMSELQAALLFSQLEYLESLRAHHITIWNLYQSLLRELQTHEKLILPEVPDLAEVNGTHFFIVLKSSDVRMQLKNFLNANGVDSSFHYLALHRSPYYGNRNHQNLPNADRFESCLLRLPIHHEVNENNVLQICGLIYAFFQKTHE